MKASMVMLAVLLAGYVRCDGNEIDNEPSPPSEESLKRALSASCGVREPSACIALELVGYVDRMLRTAALQISDDLLIVDDSNGAAAELPAEPATLARAGASLTDQAQSLIAEKLWNLATTRSLRYRLVDNADLVVSGGKREDGGFGVGSYCLKSLELLSAEPATLARAGASLTDQAQSLIAEKLWNLATTRSLRYRLVDNADLVVSGGKREDGGFGVGSYCLKSLELLPAESATLARAGASLTDQAQSLIAEKLWNLATTRSLRYRLVDNADLVVSGGKREDGGFGVGSYCLKSLELLPAEPATLARAGASLTDQAQSLIAEKLWNLATTRSLRYRLVDNADLVVSGGKREDGGFGVGVTVKQARDVETGRRRRPYGPLFAAAAMKIGLMGALAFKGLTLLVGKALLIGKIALLLASIIGLKKLFSNQD